MTSNLKQGLCPQYELVGFDWGASVIVGSTEMSALNSSESKLPVVQLQLQLKSKTSEIDPVAVTHETMASAIKPHVVTTPATLPSGDGSTTMVTCRSPGAAAATSSHVVQAELNAQELDAIIAQLTLLNERLTDAEKHHK